MREFITAEDIHRLASQGQKEVALSPEAVVTHVAEEVATRLGLRIVRREDRASEAAEQQQQSPVVSNGTPPQQVIQLRPRTALAQASRQEARTYDLPADPVIATADQSPFSETEHRRWRAEFPSLSGTIHVANCSQGAQSRDVRAAIEGYMDNWASSGMDWDYWVEEVNKAKAEFARFINARPEDVAVVGSVSEAVSSVASGIDYEGDRPRVLLTDAEFPTVGHVWLAHKKYGAEVDFVPLVDGEIRLEDYDRLMDERTFLASITHVYYQTGYKQDLKAVADIIHSKGGYVLVDAYQSCGSCNIDVQELGIDVLTTGNLKYLLGVPGIAFVYVRPDMVPALRPAETGWFGQENPFAFDVKNLDYAKSARRLESGTPPVTAAFAARAGMELLQEVGLDRIEQQVDYLSAHCLRGALARGLDVMSPLDVKKKGATTAVRVPGDSHEVELKLKERGIVTSARGPVIRIAPHFFNTTAELDVVLDELASIVQPGASLVGSR